MEKYMKKIVVDFNAESPLQTFFAKQGDINSRCLLIEPQLNGDKIDIRDCSVKLHVQRPDSQYFVIDGTTTEDGDIYVELTDDITCISGMAKCDIKLTSEDQILSSCLFHINIVKSVLYSNALPEMYGGSNVKNDTVIIPKGTTYHFNFSLVPNFKAKWLEAAKRSPVLPFEYKDKVFFGIKKNPSDKDYIFKKSFQVKIESTSNDLLKNGNFGVVLEAEDTNVTPGVYYYSITAKFANNSSGYFEIVPPTPLVIRNIMMEEGDF